MSGAEYFKKRPGANFRSFYDGDGVKFLDADAAEQFRDCIPVTKYRPTRFPDGKMLTDDQGIARGRISHFDGMKHFIREPDAELEAGERLNVQDFAEGNAVELPLGSAWRSEAPREP